MNRQLWNPFQEFEDLLERYSQTGGRNLRKTGGSEMMVADWAPSVDIDEEDDRYVIRADLPGVDKNDIQVNLENGVLSIRGEKHVERESGKEGSKRHRTERFHGTFARSFNLPTQVEADRVEASYRDGVLNLVIPKAEEAKPRAIDIKVQ